MSVIDLDTAKGYLDVIHSADDGKLQLLLDAAEDEAAQYMNRRVLEGPWARGAVCEPCSELSSETASEGEAIPKSVVLGVMLFLQAAYDAAPDDIEKYRQAGEVKLSPYRLCMGV
ncbi:head-tail connector protein [Achromobacter pestifer]